MKLKFICLLFLAPIFIHAQDVNKIVIEERSGKPMIVGLFDRAAFADTNFSWWFEPEYNNYDLNRSALDSIEEKLSGIKIKIVFGTWCSDSRREVPRFMKMLDTLNFNPDSLKMICVNRQKKAEGTEVGDLNILFVPSFIIYKNDEELGRIIEEPDKTLEEDLKAILYK